MFSDFDTHVTYTYICIHTHNERWGSVYLSTDGLEYVIRARRVKEIIWQIFSYTSTSKKKKGRSFLNLFILVIEIHVCIFEIRINIARSIAIFSLLSELCEFTDVVTFNICEHTCFIHIYRIPLHAARLLHQVIPLRPDESTCDMAHYSRYRGKPRRERLCNFWLANVIDVVIRMCH